MKRVHYVIETFLAPLILHLLYSFKIKIFKKFYYWYQKAFNIVIVIEMTKMIFLALYVGYVTQTKQLATDTKNKETIEHYLTTVKSCIVEYQSIICYHWFFYGP